MKWAEDGDVRINEKRHRYLMYVAVSSIDLWIKQFFQKGKKLIAHLEKIFECLQGCMKRLFIFTSLKSKQDQPIEKTVLKLTAIRICILCKLNDGIF